MTEQKPSPKNKKAKTESLQALFLSLSFSRGDRTSFEPFYKGFAGTSAHVRTTRNETKQHKTSQISLFGNEVDWTTAELQFFSMLANGKSENN